MTDTHTHTHIYIYIYVCVCFTEMNYTYRYLFAQGNNHIIVKCSLQCFKNLIGYIRFIRIVSRKHFFNNYIRFRISSKSYRNVSSLLGVNSILQTTSCMNSIFFVLSRNSEAFATKYLEYLERVLLRYYMHSNVWSRFKTLTTHYCVIHLRRVTHQFVVENFEQA